MVLDKTMAYFVVNNFNLGEEPDLFGVEVELEGSGGISKPTMSVANSWKTVKDGSLRILNDGDEAIEYVLNKPMNFTDTADAVNTLMSFLNTKKVYNSYRTSIHVHVNCLSEKMIHLYNFITLCIIFDELLTSQNGSHRIGNNFCFRAVDAQGQVQDLIHSIENYGNLVHINGNLRYCSINFASLVKYGSVEFRSLECTLDTKRIIQWIKTIGTLKDAARDFIDPTHIIRTFSQHNIDTFMVKVLGAERALAYMKDPNYTDMVFNGMRLAQDFAFCATWRSAKEEKKKKLDDLNIKYGVEAAPVPNPWVMAMNVLAAEPAPPADPFGDDEDDNFFEAYDYDEVDDDDDDF